MQAIGNAPTELLDEKHSPRDSAAPQMAPPEERDASDAVDVSKPDDEAKPN